MSIDSNLAMAIIAFVALISPIITAIINNYYQSKREDIQNYELAKRQALIDFIRSASLYHQHKTSIRCSDLLSSINNLYIYFSNIPSDTLDLEKINYNEFEDTLNYITVRLAKQIEKK